MSEKDSGDFIGNYACIKCTSSDGMSVYQHEDNDGGYYYDAYCWSNCKKAFSNNQLAESNIGADLGINKSGKRVDPPPIKAVKQDPMTYEEVLDFIDEVGYKSNNYRGIRDEISESFGHLTKLNDKGRVVAQYYPETKNGEVVGYKCRNHPKDFRFGKLGVTGSTCDLSGQVLFNNGGRFVLLVGGEADKAAAYQMLKDYQDQRGYSDRNPVAVVSPTVGETGCIKQVAAQYEWFDKFENIIVGFDSDEAGMEAAKEVAKVLPATKVKIAHWTGKDPNEMLLNRQHKQFISDFYSAKDYVQSHIISSSDLDVLIEEELLTPKIPLPHFMCELQKMMCGGIPLGYIVNFCAYTGVGKTSIVNEMIYYWIFNSPHKIGVVSLELTGAQYGLAMLSRHIGNKLQLFEDGNKAVDFIRKPEIVEKRTELWHNEFGEPRWYLMQERDGSLGEIEKQCELMIKKYGIKVIILDPLQDALDGSTNEDQAMFMKWQKGVVKSGVTFININHLRKQNSKGGDSDPESSVHGSSSIVKSGGSNIFFTRDKMAEDPVERNTTKAFATKIRWTGHSGNCGEYYYDIKTHTLHDKVEYFKIKKV